MALSVNAQDAPQQQAPQGYEFTVLKELPATSVKDQNRSGTCWSFAGLAFIESELLRTGKGEFDLSEMWIVRHTYFDKAERYARMHGLANFGGGGATHDVTDVIRKTALFQKMRIPASTTASKKHDHFELDALLEAYMNALVKIQGRILPRHGKRVVKRYTRCVSYLGKAPEKFHIMAKSTQRRSFADYLG